jgi:hypothetical protein
VIEAGSSIVVESGRTCRPLRSDEATPGKWQTVKPAISKDVPTGKLQTYRAAIVDSIKGDIIGRRGRGIITNRNQAAERSFGRAAGETAGPGVSRLFHLFPIPQAGAGRQ